MLTKSRHKKGWQGWQGWQGSWWRRGPKLGVAWINFALAVFITLLANHSFLQHTLQDYPLTLANSGFLLSLLVLIICLSLMLITLLTLIMPARLAWIVLLLITSLSAYVMDSWGLVIDNDILQSALETDLHETLDLLTPRLFTYLLMLFVLPLLAIYWIKIPHSKILPNLRRASLTIVAVMLIMIGCIGAYSSTYASFIREHKPLRYRLNPAAPLYVLSKLAVAASAVGSGKLTAVGPNASIPASDTERELIVVVAGETARSDHFSVNGYVQHNTNPGLEQEAIISFQQVSSCGTATAVSLPCMFSLQSRKTFKHEAAMHAQNVLDVMSHAGVNVLWRENNTGDKGLAARVEMQSFVNSDRNPTCDFECRDIGMLTGLDDYIRNHPQGDIVIVLHQMGSHGPAYWHRTPASAQYFQPACHDKDLNECSSEEINNAYDNTILYTDAFLTQLIAFLKSWDKQFETAMLYVSDHGESLGENNVYLHGLPYFIAPEEQTHVPMLFWFGKQFHVDRAALRRLSGLPYSHDNLSHTLLGMLEINSSDYDPDLDILRASEQEGIDRQTKMQPRGRQITMMALSKRRESVHGHNRHP